MSVLNTCVVSDLNGLDTYTFCAVYEQNSVMARHERTKYMHALLACYTVCNVIRDYIHCSHVCRKYLMKIL